MSHIFDDWYRRNITPIHKSISTAKESILNVSREPTKPFDPSLSDIEERENMFLERWHKYFRKENASETFDPPNIQKEREVPFYQRAQGETLMLERLLSAGCFDIDPNLRPHLEIIAKRLELLAMDMHHDLNDLKSTLADSVKPGSPG